MRIRLNAIGSRSLTAFGVMLVTITVVGMIGCVSQVPIEAKHQQILEVEGSQSDIFDLSRQWVAREFRKANEVIQYENATDGRIIAKGYSVVNYIRAMSAQLWFTMTIETQDGRARITFDQLYNRVVTSGRVAESPLTLQSQWDVAERALEQIVDNYSTFMRAGSDDW